MDVFEAHKYLDPTTLDDSSFLSFSSFADLTRSPYDEFITLPTSPSASAKVNHKPPPPSSASSRYLSPSHSPPQTFGLYQAFEQSTSFDLVGYSTPTPPSSHSDSGSESPGTPVHHVSSSSFPNHTPITPAINDFGTYHSPSSSPSVNTRAGPSRLSYPTYTTTPSHHVSHRSTSSSSDWNSPVTPSLTYKSSIDSLSSLGPEQDYFLPPTSSHTAFGWDDQSLGSSSSLAPRSPPSPSPHRVSSNPTLGKSRHPRSLTQVKSLPSLREEGINTMEAESADAFAALFAEFTDDTDYTSFGSLTDDIPIDTWNALINQSSDVAGTMFESTGEIDMSSLANFLASEPSTSRGSTSNGTNSSDQITSLDQHAVPASSSIATAPSLVPDMTMSSTTTTAADLGIYGWQPDGVQYATLNYTDETSSYNVNAGPQPPTIMTTSALDAYRPATVQEPQHTASRRVSSSSNLAVPPQGMARR